MSAELILLDAEMPHLDGFEACRIVETRARNRGVPVVLMTGLGGHAPEPIEVAGREEPAKRPIDSEELMQRMRSALAQPGLQGELEPAAAVLASLGAALEAKDDFTRGHSRRVALLARRLAAVWGLAPCEQARLWRAGLLHDVGKIGVPGESLRKPRPLAPDERRLVQRHAEISHEICKPLPSLEPVLGLVRGHHERLDGSGYPDGLSGEEITPALHCLIVADSYDALLSARPYRRGLTSGEALSILFEEVRLGRLLGDVVELLARLAQAPNPAMVSCASTAAA